jgi:hypothetical protein
MGFAPHFGQWWSSGRVREAMVRQQPQSHSCGLHRKLTAEINSGSLCKIGSGFNNHARFSGKQ